MDPFWIIVIVLVSLSPILWFIGGFLFKIIWSLWPLPTCLAVAGMILWKYGMEAFVVVPVSLILGILVTWMWQRTRLFLKVDDLIGRATMLD